jgi:DNA-binding CsgD family transcriptional regulator
MAYEEFDLLPDEIDWRDEGCEVFGSCLNCPLPRCVEEEPRGQQRLRLAARNRRMVELRWSGESVADIAGLFGVSRRTVERALKNQKQKVKNQNDRRGRAGNDEVKALIP